jgi:hypothetical protein
VAQRVFKYHQQRYLQRTKLFAPSAEPASSVLVDVYQEKKLGGIVEKMELNLTDGFTSNTEITGVIL